MGRERERGRKKRNSGKAHCVFGLSAVKETVREREKEREVFGGNELR